jgi:hypothetical protein
LIPFGNPLTVTVTWPVDPFSAFSETVTGDVVAPTEVETEEGETAILKSEAGGGGGGEELPHPPRRHRLQIEIKISSDFFMTPLQDSILMPKHDSHVAQFHMWLLIQFRGC